MRRGLRNWTWAAPRKEGSGDFTNVYKDLTGHGGGLKVEPSSFQWCTVTGQEVIWHCWKRQEMTFKWKIKLFLCGHLNTGIQYNIYVQRDCKGIQKPCEDSPWAPCSSWHYSEQGFQIKWSPEILTQTQIFHNSIILKYYSRIKAHIFNYFTPLYIAVLQ